MSRSSSENLFELLAKSMHRLSRSHSGLAQMFTEVALIQSPPELNISSIYCLNEWPSGLCSINYYSGGAYYFDLIVAPEKTSSTC